MTEQWQELKETIKELRYSNGNLTQQEVCSFLGVYMETLEKQMQESTNAKETIIKSALKYLVKMQIEEGGVGFAVDNDHDHDCCWDDVLAWIEAQPNSNEFFNFDAPMVKNSDAVSRSEVLDEINEIGIKGFVNYGFYSNLYDFVDSLPSVTPQASEEDIHREREQAYMLGYEDASKKFRTEPCEDCISRQAVDDAIYDYSRSCDVNYEQIMEFIDKLPSVKPKYTDEEIDKAQAVEQAYVEKMVELAVEESKRPKGKWIKIPITLCHYPCDGCAKDKSRANDEWCSSCEFWKAEDFNYKCSECGKIYSETENYCPNCGSYNGGDEDETSD